MSAQQPEFTDPLADVAWGAAEVCGLVESAVRKWLPVCLSDDLNDPVVWEQLPAPEAMRTADVPAIAFTTPGLAQPPEHPENGNRRAWDAWWTVVISMWVRGDEGTYSNTTSALRRYVKAVRSAALIGAREHGDEWMWRAEEYDPFPVAAARTLQMGFVQFDVPVYGAVDLSKFPLTGDLPRVTKTYVTVHPKNPEEEP